MTVRWLSNKICSTFQPSRRWRDRRSTVKQLFSEVSSNWKNFKKSRWTVTRQWSEVTRLSADCQTTFFGRSNRFGKILKKVAERSRDSGWGHATVGGLSNNVFWTFQAIWENFEKIRWTVTRQWSEVTRPSADCQTTFFGRSNRFGKILKKVAERSRDSGWGHATVGGLSNNVFWTFQAIRKFWKNSLNGHATVVGGHATIGRLSNNVFRRFKQLERILKKVAERSRDSGRRSRDRRLTVKQRFFDVSRNLGKFWKKSLNGHATVVGGHATVGRLSNSVFGCFKQLEIFLKKVTERSRDSGRRSRDCRPTVKQRFFDVSSN